MYIIVLLPLTSLQRRWVFFLGVDRFRFKRRASILSTIFDMITSTNRANRLQYSNIFSDRLALCIILDWATSAPQIWCSLGGEIGTLRTTKLAACREKSSAIQWPWKLCEYKFGRIQVLSFGRYVPNRLSLRRCWRVAAINEVYLLCTDIHLIVYCMASS